MVEENIRRELGGGRIGVAVADQHQRHGRSAGGVSVGGGVANVDPPLVIVDDCATAIDLKSGEAVSPAVPKAAMLTCDRLAVVVSTVPPSPTRPSASALEMAVAAEATPVISGSAARAGARRRTLAFMLTYQKA